MFFVLSCIRSDTAPQDVWDHYYHEKAIKPNYNQETNHKISLENEKIFVYECSFISIADGAIKISNEKLKFLHSFCFFDSCSNNGNGGAIYFECDGSIVQDRFCSINESLNGNMLYGIHSYTSLSEKNGNNLNIIVESCITQCGSANQFHTIRFSYGICGIFSTNVSKNSVEYVSGFMIKNPIGTCVINFSTFENNFADQNYCLYHDDSRSCKFHDFLCNIINNKQDDSDGGCIVIDGKELTVENCTVLNKNTKGSVFYTKYHHPKLTIINCKLDIFKIYIQFQATTITSNNIIANELNPLHHISTRKCYVNIHIEKSKLPQYFQMHTLRIRRR